MTRTIKDAILPAKLQPGDRVCFVSPASPVAKDSISTKVLEDLGLVVEFGKHVYDVDDTIDYLAGKDEDRLADINDALRDPGVKAIIATRGGKGAYRIADGHEATLATFFRNYGDVRPCDEAIKLIRGSK